MTGRAQQAYTALTVDEAGEYDNVKQAILTRYDINAETYCRRFRSLAKRSHETYREMAVRGMDLFNKWTRECDSREKMVAEQVLMALPEDICIWVWERKPKTATEAGQLAGEYLQARGLISNTRRIDQGRKTESKDRPFRSPTDGQHLIPGNKGNGYHSRPQGPPPARGQPWNQGAIRSGEVTCFTCGNRGHVSMQCPSKALFCS